MSNIAVLLITAAVLVIVAGAVRHYKIAPK